MSGSASYYHERRIGRYHMESNNSAQLRPVYKKPEGLFSRDYYIFYNSKLSIIMMVDGDELPETFLVKGAVYFE